MISPLASNSAIFARYDGVDGEAVARPVVTDNKDPDGKYGEASGSYSAAPAARLTPGKFDRSAAAFYDLLISSVVAPKGTEADSDAAAGWDLRNASKG